jgi:hypothetical protein
MRFLFKYYIKLPVNYRTLFFEISFVYTLMIYKKKLYVYTVRKP